MTTEERLEALERRFTRAKRQSLWLVGAMAIVVAALGLGMARVWMRTAAIVRDQGKGGVAKEIRATAFILEDPNGNERGIFKMTAKGPILALCDEDGRRLALFGACEEGQVLGLCDEEGRFRLGLGVANNHPMLGMYDASGHKAVALGSNDAGIAMTLADPNGRDRAGIGLRGDLPWLNLCDSNGKGSVKLLVIDGEPRQVLFDPYGKLRVSLDASRRNTELRLYDAIGKAYATVDVNSGHTALRLADLDGRVRAVLDVGTLGEVLLGLNDENGRVRIGLNLLTPLVSMARRMNRSASTSAMLEVENDVPRLTLYGSNGTARTTVGSDDDQATIRLYDKEGQTRATLGVEGAVSSNGTRVRYPESSLLLFGPDGRVLWSAP